MKKRKEVHLWEVTIGRLQRLADKKKWSLKQYMEYVLERDSNKEATLNKKAILIKSKKKL